MRPYRVAVVVALPEDELLPEPGHRTWCDELKARLDSAFAALWRTTVMIFDRRTDDEATFDTIFIADADRPRAAAERWSARLHPSADKVMFLMLHGSDARWRIVVREYDTELGFLGPIEECETAAIDTAVECAAATVAAVFSPQARFEPLPDGTIALQARGERLPLRDAAAAIALGDLFRLFLRPRRAASSGNHNHPATEREHTLLGDEAAERREQLDAQPGSDAVFTLPAQHHEETELSKIQRRSVVAIPFTVAELNQIGPKGAIARVISRWEHPFDLAMGIGIERVALRTGRLSRATPLRLTAPTVEAEPIGEWAVFELGLGPTPTCLGLTNRRGRFIVPAGNNVLRRLALSDGGQLLPEFLFVGDGSAGGEVAVGSENEAIAAELYLLPLRNALIDELARRAAFVARLERALSVRQWDKAEELLTEVKKLPSAKQWITDAMLRLGKLPGAQPRLSAHIDAFRNEAQQVLEKQIGPQRISHWEKAITEGRKPPEPPEGATQPGTESPAAPTSPESGTPPTPPPTESEETGPTV